MIWRVQIPVDNGYGTGVHYLSLYFEGEQQPTKNDVCDGLDSMALSGSNLIEDALDVLNTLDELPFLTKEDREQWCFVHHEKWGRQPLYVTKIIPFILEE